ncbi:MAG: hypothetical protein GEU75_17580, partial [Dehalococcoidia bacterium]|nr:hypothetical protein [Dehalococcoidia bacterium]
MQERLRLQNPWLKGRALSWLARLPFLEAYELSLLLGVTEREAQWLLFDLQALRWVDQITPSSPWLQAEPLHLLNAGAVSAFACQLGISENEAQAIFPIGHRDVMHRLSRLETWATMNRLLADLVYDFSKSTSLQVDEVLALPISRKLNSSWRPPGVEGYGCLKGSASWAPFFVAMDRSEAPLIHRRKRVADWYAFRDEGDGWGNYWMPTILIVAAGPQASEQWSEAILSAADRRQVEDLDILLTDAHTAISKGLFANIWHRPNNSSEGFLQGCLTWVNFEPVIAKAKWLPGTEAPVELSVRQPKLSVWANQVSASVVAGGAPAGTMEELAGVSLVIGATEKSAIQWLGSHPMLSAPELGIVLKLDERKAERLVSGLLRYHLVEALTPSKDESSEPRYLLTELGLKLLAARDGVPYRTHVRNGLFSGLTKDREGQHRLGPLLYHPEHTIGINRFFVGLIRESRPDGPRLATWWPPAESTLWFTHDDARTWLQPDGIGDLSWPGQTRRFFLEWDRGTMRWPEMTEKFRRYASYYACLANADDMRVPDTLIVTSSPQRESAIWERLESALAERDHPPGVFLTSYEPLIERLGPFADVWRSSADDL